MSGPSLLPKPHLGPALVAKISNCKTGVAGVGGVVYRSIQTTMEDDWIPNLHTDLLLWGEVRQSR